MKINEIFLSVQGEGLHSGLPTIFIRTVGCNLRCSYCDTKYAYDEGETLTIEEIVNKVKNFNTKRICITGGEPLLQKDIIGLIKNLEDYSVSIETNGSLDISGLPKNVFISLDIKCPSSNESEKMCLENLKNLKGENQVKFIMGTKEDYEFAKSIVREYSLINAIFFPIGGLNAKWIVEKILNDKLDVRVGLQIHKIIWNPNQRGV